MYLVYDMRRWFTADFHIGMTDIIKYENRPFSDIKLHDGHLINICKAIPKDDVIIHIGDLYSMEARNILKPLDFVTGLDAVFVNIRGNHDLNNNVKSLCDSMQIHLGKRFPSVICGHYPSYDRRALRYIKPGYILLCGHVHGRWKHFLDTEKQILNINVGVDVWDYRLASEDDLVRYIISIIQLPKDKVNISKNGDIR